MSTNQINSAERIAKNTIIQYIRLIVNVLTGLYSVRLILNALGTNDYGIFGLISGIVTLLTFISSSLSQTSIRFIGVSLGKENKKDTRITFSNCFWIHFVMALFLVIVLISFGPYIITNYLVIPPERTDVAVKVFECIALILFLNIIKTPFEAVIISNENFTFTGIASILISLLKLAIAFIITYTTKDKLLLYGIYLLGITILDFLLFLIYSHYKYSIGISYRYFSKSKLKEISSFASWTVLDVLGSVFSRDGYAVLLNRFFGPLANAVFSLARQIEGQLYSISSATIQTFKPQIMKKEGVGDRQRMLSISITAGKLGFSMMSIITIPLLVTMPTVLDIWLVNVPKGTVIFTRFMVGACMMNQLTQGLVYANQATGKIWLFSVVVSGFRMISLPISILFFVNGYPIYSAIIVFFICESLGSFSRIFIISHQLSIKAKNLIVDIFIRILPAFFLSMLLCIAINILSDSFLIVIINFVLTSALYLTLTYLFTLNNSEQDIIKNIILKRINIIKKTKVC